MELTNTEGKDGTDLGAAEHAANRGVVSAHGSTHESITINLRHRRERGKSFDCVLHGRRNDDPMMIVEIGASEPQHAPAHERSGVELPAVLDESCPARVPPTREGAAVDLDSEHPVGPGEVEAPSTAYRLRELQLLDPWREAQPAGLG